MAQPVTQAAPFSRLKYAHADAFADHVGPPVVISHAVTTPRITRRYRSEHVAPHRGAGNLSGALPLPTNL